MPNDGHFNEEEERRLLNELFPKNTHRVRFNFRHDPGSTENNKPRVFETYQRWHVEGDFLIIYYREDHVVYRQAHRIPSNVVSITEELIYNAQH